MDQISIAYVANTRSQVTHTESNHWNQFSAKFSKPTIGVKEGLGWIPAHIEPGARQGHRVLGVTALVLDIERDKNKDDEAPKSHPPHPYQIEEALQQLGYRWLLHTTFGHAPEAPRYRLIFQISRPLICTPQGHEVRLLGLHAAHLLGLSEFVDKSCLEPARLFYLPRCTAENLKDFVFLSGEGSTIDVDGMLDEAQKLVFAADSAPSKKAHSKSSAGSVIDKFNDLNTPGQILVRNGYKANDRNRHTFPGSESGVPGVHLLPGSGVPCVYSFHAGDPLHDGRRHDAFDIFRILEHAGDWHAAVKAAAEQLGIMNHDASTTIPLTPLQLGPDNGASQSQSTETLAGQDTSSLAKTMRHAGEIATAYISALDDRRKDAHLHFHEAPFHDLNRVAPAIIHNGHLIVIAGRPAMGKTALAQQIAEYIAQDKTAIIFSLEMSSYEVIERAICCRTGINIPKLKDPSKLDQEDWAKIASAQVSLDHTHLLIDDACFDINSLIAKTKGAAAALEKRDMPPLGVIVVDYLQLVAAGKRGSTRAEDVSTISRGLKRLARDLNVPVIALSQLNRAVEGRPDKRPGMADLRESGAIEQDADVVLLLYRDEVYNNQSKDRGIAELAIAKNRHGGTGVAKLAWLPERVRFGDLSWTDSNSNVRQVYPPQNNAKPRVAEDDVENW
ncbi:MAG: DnaB-like helicase C-terminal domain-containing protein [Betaproteobacteria bacterium]|nr:DnaB-like helicase C-terminal domain-containing protein [Betaproteobacteria bacterium]